MWLRCVGSVYLGKGTPNLDAEYNASGSCSHWLGEWQLNHPELDLNSWLGKEMTFGDNPAFKFVIDEERIGRVRAYVEAVVREPGMRMVEERLDTTPVLGVPDQEGHSDVVQLYPEGGVVKDGKLLRGVLTVRDFKDGHIMVHAKDNTQGMIYLCAAMIHYSLLGEFEAYRFCIHQPKLHHYDEWTYTRAELEAFMDAIRPIAKIAYDLYYGTLPFDPAKHLTAGEEQCLWCPVRGRCPARAQYIISLLEPIIMKHEINEETLGSILAVAGDVKAALDDYEAEALRRASNGVKIPGQKLIRGRRGDRRWVDPKQAEGILSLVLPDEQLYEPRTIISPAQAERLLKGDKSLGAYVTQSEGKLKLAPEDDPHQEVKLEQFKPVPESLT
jgi:Protein of unknown function (DUF2800)